MQKLIVCLCVLCFWWCTQSCTICSCKKYPCAGYSNVEFDAWMKEFSNKEILFTSNSNRVDTFRLSPVQLSENYEAEKGCMHGDNGCNSSFHVSSFESFASTYPEFEVWYRSFTGWDGKTSLNIELRVKDFHIQASEITQTGLIIPDSRIHTDFASVITLRGKTYTNVQSIHTDAGTKVNGIYKIYLSRNKGLVAFEEFPSHDVWLLQ